MLHTSSDTPVMKQEVVFRVYITQDHCLGHKHSFSMYQPLGINSNVTDKIQNTKLQERHAKSIIHCKVEGIAHKRLMAFY